MCMQIINGNTIKYTVIVEHEFSLHLAPNGRPTKYIGKYVVHFYILFSFSYILDLFNLT